MPLHQQQDRRRDGDDRAHGADDAVDLLGFRIVLFLGQVVKTRARISTPMTMAMILMII